MYHQTKGVFLSEILRDEVIATTPRFNLAGKTQEELERELTPTRRGQGLGLYSLAIPIKDGGTHHLIWEKGERPAVWLTDEPRPIGSIGSGSLEAEESFKGFFRIGIDTSKVEVYPWVETEKRTGVSKKWRQILSRSAQMKGDDTSKWYFALVPIPKAVWTSIERWERLRWVEVK